MGEESPCQFCEQGQALAKSYGYIFDLASFERTILKEGPKAYDAQVQRNRYVEQILNNYSGGSDEIKARRNRLTTDHKFNPVERCLNCEEGIRMGGRPACEESPCEFCEQGQALAKSYGYIFDLHEVYEKEGPKAYDAQVQRNRYV